MNKEQNELLERAKKLRESTQLARTNGWLYRNIISPIVAHPWTGKPFRWYRTLCEKIVYIPTKKASEEIWYLGKSQEIDPAGNIFSAQGCESVECSDQTSIYFRIKQSLTHQLWSLYSYGNFFFPDFVAGGIQNDINKCEVTGYGSRLKFLVRNWDIYPQILSVTCVPLSEIEILNARKTAPTQ